MTGFAMESMDEVDLDAPPTVGMIESVKFVVKEFLEESHFRALHQALSTAWSRQHSLSAAMKLMEAYDVKLTPEEVDHLSSLDEESQISQLVMRSVPNMGNEQFQHFFLQLQLLVSTAMRVRRAVEDGDPGQLEEALNDADKAKIAPYILQIAIVHAGSEVSTLKSQFKVWTDDVDGKLGRLIRGQEDAIAAEKKLAFAKAKLVQVQSGHVDKVRKVITRWGDDFRTIMKSQCFKGWFNQWRVSQNERTIYAEYEAQILDATDNLNYYRGVYKASVGSFMRRKGDALQHHLLRDVVAIWQEHTASTRGMQEHVWAAEDLTEKLQTFSESQKHRAVNVFTRFNQDGDIALLRILFAAFTQSYEEHLHDTEFEDQTKGWEANVSAQLKTCSEHARHILDGIYESSKGELIRVWTSAYMLKGACFKAWTTDWKEVMAEQINVRETEKCKKQVGVFNQRNKKAAHQLMVKAEDHSAIQLVLRVYYAWRLETKVEAELKVHYCKIDAKREQLVGVQKMFRNFAYKLESKLKDGGDTARELHQGAAFRRKHQAMQRGDAGSVSLPDIQAHKSRTPQYQGTPDDRERRGRRTPSQAASSGSLRN